MNTISPSPTQKSPTINAKNLNRAEHLANWFDSSIKIPGTELSIGLDGILGLVPGIGDAFSSVVSSYIIYLAYIDGVPRLTTVRMIINVIIDTIIGTVPVVGDLTDLFWKANIRNVSLWKARTVDRDPRASDWIFIVFTLAVLAFVIGVAIYGSIWLFGLLWRAVAH